jgi:PD-(D/E)XK endonuclease
MLSTNQKGAIAETAVVHRAVRLGIDVYRPVVEGARYDLIFVLSDLLLRVQCKWAVRDGGVIPVRCYSSRRSSSGFLRRPYTRDEVDAIAAYCPELDRCYLLPLALFGTRTEIQLRLVAAQNEQRARINWADDFVFERLDLIVERLQGAIAQLGERVTGSHEVAGSNPAGSTQRLSS